jgi:hypothetical protein
VPASLTEIAWIRLRDRSGVDQDDVVVPVSIDANTGLDLSTMASNATDLRVFDTEGLRQDFYVERADVANDELFIWLRVDHIPADSYTDLLFAWGDGSTLSASNGSATFDVWLEGDRLPFISRNITFDGECQSDELSASQVDYAIPGDELWIDRQSQEAFFYTPGNEFCGPEMNGLTLNARAYIDTTHFDRDVRAGFIYAESDRDFDDGEKVPSSTVGVTDETSEEGFIYEESCARVYADAAPTTELANTPTDFEVEIRDNSVFGRIAGGEWYRHTLPPDRLEDPTCAWPVVYANADNGASDIRMRVDFMNVYRAPTLDPGRLVCTNGTLSPVSSTRDSDGDGLFDDVDLDVDGDGSDDVDDCADWDGAIHPGADEACNEVDDDCDGIVDDNCDLSIDFERTGQFDSLLWLRTDSPTTNCFDPQIDNGTFELRCPNNHGMIGFAPIPYFDGTHSLHVEVDVQTGNWTDRAPRLGIELFDGWDGDTGFDITFVGTPGWAMHLADPVDAVQVGCSNDDCPSIVSTDPPAQLAVGNGGILPNVPYHMSIDLQPNRIDMVVTRTDTGSVVSTLAALDTNPKVGLLGLLCAETICEFDNLEISTF